MFVRLVRHFIGIHLTKGNVMPLVSGLVWMVGSVLVICLTNQKYLPYLREKNEDAGEGTALQGRLRISGPRGTAVLLLLCAFFSAATGYAAAVYSLSPISYAKLLFMFLILSCILVTDWELLLIPNPCVIAVLLARIAAGLMEFLLEREDAGIQAVSSLIALVLGILLLLFLKKLTRGGLGYGDVKLLSALGFLCGLRAFCFVLTLSVVLCALLSLPLIFLKKADVKDALPLGPFIYLGFGIAIMLGAV